VGRRRRSTGPELDGVLVLDKPAGPTSHDVVEQVRRAVQQSRVGHTGTLDPAATGVLVVCLGRATRLVQYLQAGVKTYAARMVLGIETDSQDADGAVVARVAAGHVDERQVCEALGRFQGVIDQLPPMVSAVRVGGQRLHEAARRGEVIDRASRQVTVHDLILDAYLPGEHPEVDFLVTCSAGTYVRTIAHDVGTVLGVGASLSSLRRLANGPFVTEEAHSPDAVADAAAEGRLDDLLLSPLEAVSRALPVVTVEDPALVRTLTQGGRLTAQGHAGAYAVRAAEQLIGIYRDERAEGRPALVWTRPEERP
jgi:tRNA pseudouridine55 synthase